MKVADLGEFGLIELLAKMVYSARNKEIDPWQRLILGIGDDAAAWHGDTSIQLATVDSLVQDVHFSLGMASWEELGWKALAVNLSDIAAMGGLPRYALVSLGIPDSTEVADVEALYRGMIELAQRFGVAIIGGDTDSTPQIAITITVLGSTGGRDQLLTRSAARPGEKIAVTGYLGAAAAGLEMLKKHVQFDPEATASLRKAFLQPYPRVDEGGILVEKGVKAAIDISDGLISDLSHICQASRVGAHVETEHVPVHPAVRANFGDGAMELALSGGEDYELLFTASTAIIDKVRLAAPCPITVIGEILADNAGKISVVDKMGNLIDLTKAGWQHFTMGRNRA